MRNSINIGDLQLFYLLYFAFIFIARLPFLVLITPPRRRLPSCLVLCPVLSCLASLPALSSLESRFEPFVPSRSVLRAFFICPICHLSHLSPSTSTFYFYFPILLPRRALALAPALAALAAALYDHILSPTAALALCTTSRHPRRPPSLECVHRHLLFALLCSCSCFSSSLPSPLDTSILPLSSRRTPPRPLSVVLLLDILDPVSASSSTSPLCLPCLFASSLQHHSRPCFVYLARPRPVRLDVSPAPPLVKILKYRLPPFDLLDLPPQSSYDLSCKTDRHSLVP